MLVESFGRGQGGYNQPRIFPEFSWRYLGHDGFGVGNGSKSNQRFQFPRGFYLTSPVAFYGDWPWRVWRLFLLHRYHRSKVGHLQRVQRVHREYRGHHKYSVRRLFLLHRYRRRLGGRFQTLGILGRGSSQTRWKIWVAETSPWYNPHSNVPRWKCPIPHLDWPR